ncbi:MAG: DUF1579 domain-containing protein [Bacteroidota bacterium]|nr:DUF1579 domain-containing protein [Bacteroidota bacterium]
MNIMKIRIPRPTRSRLLVVLLLLALATAAAAQEPAANKKPTMAPAKNEEMQLLLDFSRPGNNHALLGVLAGTWTFQDAARPFIKGTLRRTPMYDGRFYNVEITGGKLSVPVADGKMKEANYQGLQLEGYDNGRKQFVTTAINNHIGSAIEVQTGTYDAAKRAFSYEWESELIPGLKKKNRRVLRFIDTTHYAEDYYESQNGTDVKVRELVYTKAP